MPTHPCVFFLVTLLIIHPAPAPAQAHSHSKCNESFHCGHLGTLQFPFTEIHNSQCGLFLLNCTSSPHPLIQFGSGGAWLQFLFNNASANKARVLDPNLNMTMLDPGKCLPVGSPYNNSPPFPLALFSIHPHITVVYCPKYLIPPSDHDPFPAGFKYNPYCDAFDLYYGDVEIEGTTDIPQNCSVVHLPTRTTPGPHGSDQPLQQLSQEYEVEWRVSPACNFSCYLGGGTCLVNATTQQVNCDGAVTDQQKPKDEGDQQKAKDERDQHKAKDERDPLPRKVILVAVICGSAFLVLCFVVSFLILRRHRKNKLNGPYLLSRSISSGPSSTSDLQLGGGRFFLGILVFSYQELHEATNNFDPSKELGEGGFGIVYYGKLRDGREVAIKRLYEHNCRRVEQFLNEIKILADLRHPNLVTLFGCASRRSRELLLVYEYIPNGTVADHLHGEMAQTSPLTWPVRMTIAVETASALAYLHKTDIIHRDVKTYNILLDNNFSVKVADFGLSRLFPNDVSHISTAPQGTPGYVDPEYHQCYQLTDKSDVYSFGVVLIELISSMPPVDITRHRHEINLANLAVDRIQRCAFDELIDSSLGHQTDAEVARMTMSVAELAFRCLQLEKDLRPSMDEVLEFLKDIQAREDCNLEKKERSNGKYFVPGKLLTSPETDDAALLKGNIPSSPVTVTNTWPSVVAPPPQVP